MLQSLIIHLIQGGMQGGPRAGIYGTSKAGVHAITRALAKDLAEYNIRVNAVSPGTIDTPFHAQIKATKPEVFASWKNNIMLGRLGQPEEVASVVSFLASDNASFITAETIQIGGGQALGIYFFFEFLIILQSFCIYYKSDCYFLFEESLIISSAFKIILFNCCSICLFSTYFKKVFAACFPISALC